MTATFVLARNSRLRLPPETSRLRPRRALSSIAGPRPDNPLMAEAAATIEAPAQAHAYVEGARKWIIALSVILCTILEVLDSSIVNVALPHMQGSFSATVDEVTWVVTTYLVAAGIMIPTTGWIAGQFGRKRYFLISIATFVISSAMCGAAQTLNQMVAFRFLQGIAGAALQPLSQAILMETFPPNEQTLAMAVWGLGLMVAPIMGPTVGGYITDNWNWRWNFYINVPIGIAAGFMVSTFVHDPSYLRKLKGKGAADWIGIVCLVLALGLGEIVMDRGERADWFATPWVWYFSIIAGSAFLILLVHEWRTPDPIVQVRYSQEPQIRDSYPSSHRADLQLVWDANPEPGLFAGIAWLYGVESRSRDGAARPGRNGRDVPARRNRAARLRYPADGRVWFLPDRCFDLDAGEPRSRHGNFELHLAYGDSGSRDGSGLPESLRGSVELDPTRTNGIRGESLFDDAKRRRFDRNLGIDNYPHP